MIEKIWKVYFWLLALSFGYIVTSNFYYAVSGISGELVDALISFTFIIGVIGVFGYAYKKKILNTTTWKIVFYLELFLYIVTISLFATIFEPEFLASTSGLVDTLLIIFYSLPQLTALYLYSYKSKDIWLH